MKKEKDSDNLIFIIMLILGFMAIVLSFVVPLYINQPEIFEDIIKYIFPWKELV